MKNAPGRGASGLGPGPDRREPGPAPGTWAIAAAFVGTVVGAGFASGQETLQFFTVYGRWGLANSAIAGYSLATGPGLAGALAWQGAAELAPVPAWWLGAGLYVAYNMVLAIPILAPLGAAARDRDSVAGGGVLGGVLLGLGAAAIHLTVAAFMPAAGTLDVPMLFAARTLPPGVSFAYSVLLLAEVYTTAVAMLFGVAARFAETGGMRFRASVLAGGAAALAGGLFPFAQVVGTLYPVMGVLGGVLLLAFLKPMGK